MFWTCLETGEAVDIEPNMPSVVGRKIISQ